LSIGCRWKPAVPSFRRPLAITADGNAKLTHFAKCGRAITAAYQGLVRHIKQFFSNAHDIAAELTQDLPNEAAAVDDGPCDAHMRCAKVTAHKRGGELDVKCTVGAVCSHGVPLAGGFISSDVDECFPLYVTLLAELAPQLPDWHAFVLDINCKFGKHMNTNYPGDVPATLRFYVGWLHSQAGHNINCQLLYSAMFAEGMGRCIGESTEQLWVRGNCLCAAACLTACLCWVPSCRHATSCQQQTRRPAARLLAVLRCVARCALAPPLWEQWSRFMQPDSEPIPQWEERDVFNNILPWTAASAARGPTQQHLRYKFYCTVQELQRCYEEQLYLPSDAACTLNYYQRQREILDAAMAAATAEAAALPASACVQREMLKGRLHILKSWGYRIGALQLSACESFKSIGWI